MNNLLIQILGTAMVFGLLAVFSARYLSRRGIRQHKPFIWLFCLMFAFASICLVALHVCPPPMRWIVVFVIGPAAVVVCNLLLAKHIYPLFKDAANESLNGKIE